MEADFRNQTIMHLEGEKGVKRRATCERKYAHLKKTVKFDAVHCKKNSRAPSSMMNFITFQLLTLVHIYRMDFRSPRA